MRLLIGLVVENYHHLHNISLSPRSENILLYSALSLRKVLFYVLLIKSFKRICCCIRRVSVNKVFLGFVLILLSEIRSISFFINDYYCDHLTRLKSSLGLFIGWFQVSLLIINLERDQLLFVFWSGAGQSNNRSDSSDLVS